MKSQAPRVLRPAFTLIELLVVIAIIAILAAILFPVFGAVREQTRQSNTLSNLHSVYVGARLYYEDEGRFPTSLFGYAETAVAGATSGQPQYRPLTDKDNASAAIPLDQVQGVYASTASGVTRGYLFGEQIKDYITFVNVDNPITDTRAVTTAFYPLAISKLLGFTGYTMVTWQGTPATNPPQSGGCTVSADPDLPANQGNVVYADPTTGEGPAKYFYVMDSADIGPMFDETGAPLYIQSNNQPGTAVTNTRAYELHYSPNWTHELYRAPAPGVTGCDIYSDNTPIKEQLKYKNPPSESTVLTWVTQHAATAGSSNVMVLLLSGTTKKMPLKQAYNYVADPNKSTALPFGYRNAGK